MSSNWRPYSIPSQRLDKYISGPYIFPMGNLLSSISGSSHRSIIPAIYCTSKCIITRQVSIASVGPPSLAYETFHFKGKAIEYMVVDALIAADPILKIADKIKSAAEYLYLTDSVFEDIERSTDPVSGLNLYRSFELEC